MKSIHYTSSKESIVDGIAKKIAQVKKDVPALPDSLNAEAVYLKLKNILPKLSGDRGQPIPAVGVGFFGSSENSNGLDERCSSVPPNPK